jgi:hypothetical protein
MSKIFRAAVFVFIASLLSGCILQSKMAIFAEQNGALILGNKKVKIANYELSSLAWKKGDTTAIFEPVSHHYRVFNGKSYATAEFIAISGGNYVLQFDEGKGVFVYVLARPNKNEVYLYPLTCDYLKKQQISGIQFKKDDCIVDAKFGQVGFESLLKHLPIASLKLVKE